MAEREPLPKLVRALRSGQITIPAEFRKKLGIDEQSVLQISLQEGELRIKPVRVAATAEGSLWLKQLYELFAAAREEAAAYGEEEIDAAIDQAVSAVRQKHA